MSDKSTYLHGRGAQINPANPYHHLIYDESSPESIPNTIFIPSHAKTIVNKVDSPDIPLSYSMNPYQGCEHGCIYCYARNTHPYWGYSAGIDFEQKILIKKEAPQLLKEFFDKKNYRPEAIMLSGNTDCYQPAEKTYKLTRQLLEICLKYKHPVGIITKNALILRDLDIIQALANLNLVRVVISITTLDEELRSLLEPRTTTIARRFKIIESLSALSISSSVMMAPVIPGLTDHEIHHLATKSKEAGANDFHYSLLRLNGDVETIFKDWVLKNLPDRADKILNRTADCHGGQVNDSRFKTRMKGEGIYADLIKNQVRISKLKLGFPQRILPPLDHTIFRRPSAQLSLF